MWPCSEARSKPAHEALCQVPLGFFRIRDGEVPWYGPGKVVFEGCTMAWLIEETWAILPTFFLLENDCKSIVPKG